MMCLKQISQVFSTYWCETYGMDGLLGVAGMITKGSSRGATLSFTLRSKGEGGQPGYLIHQEIASHFSTPPPRDGLLGTMRQKAFNRNDLEREKKHSSSGYSSSCMITCC